jgi:hypothetical protein
VVVDDNDIDDGDIKEEEAAVSVVFVFILLDTTGRACMSLLYRLGLVVV